LNPDDVPLWSLFNFQTGQGALEALVSSFGTATSGPLGSLTIALFLASLMWVWVKSKFDTWSFWELFLRLFITAAGLAVWSSLFFSLDSALTSVTTLFGHVNPNTQIADILLTPFLNFQPIFGIAQLLSTSGVYTLLCIILYAIAWAMYNINVVGQFFTTMLLYVCGPLFLACFVFEPLHDLWMRWVRFYLTVKVWMLMMNAFIYIVDTFLAANMTSMWAQTVSPLLAICYLALLILGFTASFPIARGLVGGGAQVIASGNFIPSAAAGAAGAAAIAGGVAITAATGNPAGLAGGAIAAGGTRAASAPIRQGAS
jgi:hypothetical protein